MFTTLHFIWLLIDVLFITSLLIINKKYKLTLKNNIRILTIISILSETTKVMINIYPNEAGTSYYLLKGQLPFHLCSLQIFLFFYLDFFCKNEKIKDTILKFMFPTMIGGAIAAILIPTEGVSFKEIQPYQYFLYHAGLIYFAIYLVSTKQIKITFKTIKNNYIILLCLVYVTININSMLQDHEANYLYLSRPPLEGLPILNLEHGYYVYFLTLVLLAVVILGIIQLPFAIKNKEDNS